MAETQTYSLEELGLKAQGTNPSTYGGMTAREAAFKALEKHPELWMYVVEDDGGPTADEPQGPSSGVLGIAAALRDTRRNLNAAGISGAPTTGLALGEALAVAPGNLASETVNFFNAFLPSNIGSTLSSMAQFAEGAGRTAARAIGTTESSMLGQAIGQHGGPLAAVEGIAGPADLDPSEQLFRSGMEYTGRTLLDPEKWISEPITTLLIATGLMPIPTRALGVPTLADLARAVNPALKMAATTRKTAGLLGKGLGIEEKTRIGVLTGRGAEAVTEAYNAVRRAPKPTRETFYRFMREKHALLNFFGMAQAAVKQVRERRSTQFAQTFPNLRPAKSLDAIHEDIRLAMREVLNERGAGVSPSTARRLDPDSINFTRLGILDAPDAELVKRWIQAVEDPTSVIWTTPGVPGTIDLEALNTIRRLAWNTVEHIPRGHQPAQSLMARMYDRTADELKKSVIGYTEVMNDYKKLSDLIQDFEDAMGVRVTSPLDRARLRNAQVKAVRNVVAALKDSPGSEVSAQLIRHMEEATGVPFLPAAAGSLFNNWVGSGIISRAQLAALFGGGSVLTGTASLPTAIILIAMQAPFVSPRIVGEVVLPAAGLTGRSKDAVLGIFKSIHAKVPADWDTDALTYFQAAQRLDEELRKQAAEKPQVSVEAIR